MFESWQWTPEVSEEKDISTDCHRFAANGKAARRFAPLEAGAAGAHRDPAESLLTGFTLIELLVVLAVVSVLMGIVLPVFSKVRRESGRLKCVSNQRQITYTMELFAIDNDDRYPQPVAIVARSGMDPAWIEPTAMTNYMRRGYGKHRAMSGYLRDYIADASIMFCPSAPRKYKYLQEAWDAGDDWHLPGSTLPDPVYGTYCFYWNYVGYLEGPDGPFRGPWGPSCRGRRGRLLVTDYLGHECWRRPNAYISSERSKTASIMAGTPTASAYWSIPDMGGVVGLDSLRMKLHAGYTDGHVDIYRPSEVVPMWVPERFDGSSPDTIGPGIFYLPADAVH